MLESNSIFNLATNVFLLNYNKCKGEAYKWGKNFRRQFLSDFRQPCIRAFVSTSIEKIRFYTISPRANEFFVQWLRPPILLPVIVISLVTSPTHKNKEESLVVNNKAVPSPATAPKFDRHKASTKIREGSVGWCYCFCDSSVVAKWLYGSYPQGV